MVTRSRSTVIVCAPVGRDGELIADFLSRFGIDAKPVSDCAQAVELAQTAAEAAIISEEALDHGAVGRWVLFLRDQPRWSDFPIIVLTSADHGSNPRLHSRIEAPLGNVTLLERPVRMESLLSAVQSALRARYRQYQIRDHIQQQKLAEETLRKTEKLAVAGRLAASIAHEINNPLAAVTNLVYLMQHTNDLNAVKIYAETAQQELERVSSIVNQTLRFHRSPTEPAPTSMASLMDSAIALFKARLRSHHVNVKTDYRTDENVVCSAGEIRQAIVNILGNAIDAMNGSGGEIKIRIAAAHNPADARPGVRVTIADRGSGIPQLYRARLFQPFFTTKGTTGTGLGLWLTRDIICRHDGSIRMKSRTGEHSGTVFSFWLPTQPEMVQAKLA
jgi:signal transduction histidine kinase